MSRKISSMLGLAVAGSMLAMAASSAQAGPKAYVGNFTDNTVSVIDTSTGSAIATIPVAAGPHGMAISQDGSTVYVAGDGSSSLNVIDTATDRVTKTLDVGKKPNGITLTPDGKLLLVTLYGEDRIALVDTATNDVVGTIPVPKPHTVSVEPSGKLAYATSQEPGHFGLAVIDLGSRSVVRTVPLDKTPRDGEFGADGKALLLYRSRRRRSPGARSCLRQGRRARSQPAYRLTSSICSTALSSALSWCRDPDS